MGMFHWFLLILSVSSICCYNEEEEEAYLFVKPFDIFFRERIKHCADSPDDATTLQHTQDAGHDNDYTADDDWDIVYYFDYTVDSSDDYYAAANDFDQEAVLLADH